MKVKALATWLICIILIVLIIPAAVSADSPLTLETAQGAVGSNVKIPAFCQYGTGDYTLLWGNANQIIMQGTIQSGTCQPITFKVPKCAAGTYMVTLKVGTKSFQKEFTVTASISLGTTKGTVGTQVFVSGSGFREKEDAIMILMDGKAIAAGISANSEGNWQYTLEIPVASKGIHPISVTSSNSKAQAIGGQTFTVTPSINVNPATGWVGEVITVRGKGFGPAERSIEILYDTTVVKSQITADKDGNWQSSFTVPSSSKGAHQIDAQSGQTDVDDVQGIPFSISPGIKVEQASGRLGDTIKTGDTLFVSGFGFQANEDSIKVNFDGSDVAENIIADAQGSWATQFQVPMTSRGEHSIGSIGSFTASNDITSYIVVITPEMTINPAAGAVGESTLLKGSGFGINQPVSIFYDGKQVDLKVTSDLNGSFSTSFKPPTSGAGEHSIAASDATHASAATSFTVESIAPDVTVLIEPEKGTSFDILGSEPILFRWEPIVDPSGVTYTLEISRKADFSGEVQRKDNLSSPEYPLANNEKKGPGDYYWRVRATDGAGNMSDWSQSLMFSITGFAFLLPGSAIVLAVLVIIGLIIWRIRAISKKGGWSSES